MSLSHKVTIIMPYMYSAWPLIGTAHGKLLCIYTQADQHVPTVSNLYMIESADGVNWGNRKEIFSHKTGVKGVTGIGYDKDGSLLVWYRNGLAGFDSSYYELFKLDRDDFSFVSRPDIPFCGGHIGNLTTIPEKGMVSFYNTYGEYRSWGMIRSMDFGVTWQQIPIEENLPKEECPAEIECVCVCEEKILVLGRKDVPSGTIAMFQMQSSDYGETWTKAYTNITDSYSGSPSVIMSQDSDEIYLYYFARTSGELKRRVAKFSDVWDNPGNWPESEVLVREPANGYDNGNVKTVAFRGGHFCTYYAGNSTLTGVFGVIVDNE